ncbi:MAG: hypothetical protein IT367_04620 [Candidatus Hydrogenedentes bacterium]|nr:hypothetical protein [Candidatus Hydrogenedentota bacterium]
MRSDALGNLPSAPRWTQLQRKARTMMLAKAAAKLSSRNALVKPVAPWIKMHGEDELRKKPHGPTVSAPRMPSARKAPLSFHRPSGRK